MSEENKKFWEEYHLFFSYVEILRQYERGFEAVEDLEKQRIEAHTAIADYYKVEREDLNGILHNLDLTENNLAAYALATTKKLIDEGLIRKRGGE